MANMTRKEFRAHQKTHNKSNSRWMHDVKGIPLCRVCGVCTNAAIASYKPAVIGIQGSEGYYEFAVEEPIEPDE